MKLLSQIFILIGFIVCISSCQKESLPVPNSSTSYQINSSNQRMSNQSDTTTHIHTIIIETKQPDEIVGGGDDDKDGGGGKKVKKDN